ncbi:MAG: hypothetical protein K6E24_04270 [bacterium]|nr:hypothetical protein [bacterium]
MIKNLEQFKTYFYLFLLDFPEIDKERLENALKHYLMYHPIDMYVISEHKRETYYDLDYLVVDFKNDDIKF